MSSRNFPLAASTCRSAFTLVELLVVIGIIGVLIAILLPSLSKAQRAAKQTACGSNLHQVYMALQIYSTESKGWLFPVGKDGVLGQPGIAFDKVGKPTTLGTGQPPDERWPVYAKAFQIRVPQGDVQYTDSATGTQHLSSKYPDGLNETTVLTGYDARRFTPAVLLCPQDLEAAEAHSYVLNQHLADERIRFGTSKLGLAHSASNVVVAGEKKTEQRDYYMESDGTTNAEFNRVVEEHRHGLKLGSNYMFMDGHVDNRPPGTIAADLDPWANVTVTDTTKLPPATPPTGG